MPTIRFGRASKEEQVRNLLIKLAPIKFKDLAVAYEEAYGVEQSTFYLNYQPYIEQFLCGDIYDLTPVELPPRHIEKLKISLNKDFYWREDLESIYQNLCEGANIELLNANNMKKLNYSAAIFLLGKTSFSTILKQSLYF